MPNMKQLVIVTECEVDEQEISILMAFLSENLKNRVPNIVSMHAAINNTAAAIMDILTSEPDE